MIGKLRQKLVTFYTHLRQEENLQKLYQEKQAGMFDGEDYGARINQDENMLDSESENMQDMIYDYSNEDEGHYQASPKQQFAPMIQN